MDAAANGDADAGRASDAVERITPGQRRALFAIAKDRGWSIDELRSRTPAGSISGMTRAEARALLDRLNGGSPVGRSPDARTADAARASPHARRPRRPKGIYAFRTDAQIRKIEALRIDLGWTQDGMDAFLAERHFGDGRPMNKIDSTADGRDVIQLLLHVLECVNRARQRTQESESITPDAASTPAPSAAAAIATPGNPTTTAATADPGS